MLKEIPHAIRPTHQKGKDPHNRIKTRVGLCRSQYFYRTVSGEIQLQIQIYEIQI